MDILPILTSLAFIFFGNGLITLLSPQQYKLLSSLIAQAYSIELSMAINFLSQTSEGR